MNDQPILPFTKEQYQRTLREKREQFIQQYFSERMAEVFNFLRKSANDEEICHHTFEFTVPRNLDVDNTEQTIRTYFSDYGYLTIPEARKDGKNRVLTITLT